MDIRCRVLITNRYFPSLIVSPVRILEQPFGDKMCDVSSADSPKPSYFVPSSAILFGLLSVCKQRRLDHDDLIRIPASFSQLALPTFGKQLRLVTQPLLIFVTPRSTRCVRGDAVHSKLVSVRDLNEREEGSDHEWRGGV